MKNRPPRQGDHSIYFYGFFVLASFWACSFILILLIPSRVLLGTQPAVGGSKQTPAAQAKKININSASPAELAQLPGIGPELAGRIVDYRRKNPPFKKIEELMIIKGIGRKTFDRLRDRITVE